MHSESVCLVARSLVDVGRFHTRLFIVFMICTASVRNILDKLSCVPAWFPYSTIKRAFDLPRRLTSLVPLLSTDNTNRT
jgi:hypothetical protein